MGQDLTGDVFGVGLGARTVSPVGNEEADHATRAPRNSMECREQFQKIDLRIHFFSLSELQSAKNRRFPIRFGSPITTGIMGVFREKSNQVFKDFKTGL